MPKYYVDSGNLRYITIANDERRAIQNAIENCVMGTYLGRAIRVNERGFDRFHNEDMFFDTLMTLQSLGIN